MLENKLEGYLEELIARLKKEGFEDIYGLTYLDRMMLTDTTDYYMLSFQLEIDDNFLQAFIPLKKFEKCLNRGEDDLIYSSIVENIKGCLKSKTFCKNNIIGAYVVNQEFINFDYNIETMTTVKDAYEFYIKHDIEEDLEEFESKFKSFIHEVGGVKIINMIYVINRLYSAL